MSQERQYERKVVKDSVSNWKSDVRDNSITDITIIEFDTGSMEGDARPCVSTRYPAAVGLEWNSQKLAGFSGDSSPAVGLEVSKNIKRIVHIHRQNDIQTTQSDSTIIQVKDSLKSNEIVQNKSSPDKVSQALFSTTTIIIILLIVLAIILIIKLVLR